MPRSSTNSVSNAPKLIMESVSTEERHLENKVIQLEETLKKFRAEVDMKMKIMEQILTTRNEMFSVQKKLLEREQVLHETVLSHWKNIPELATNGLSLQFSDGYQSCAETVLDDEIKESLLGKRPATSDTLARRDRRKRLKAKSKGVTRSGSESDCGPENDETVIENSEIPEGENEIEFENVADSSNSGLERKVFVNFYSEEPAVPGHLVTKAPIWKYYLREEGGKEALCKICDEFGGRSILKLHGGTSQLHKHLKIVHNELAGSRQQPSPIWNYFTKLSDEDSSKARCNVCFELGSTTVFKISDGCTSTLHRHLQKIHNLKATTNNSDPLPLMSTSDDNGNPG